MGIGLILLFGLALYLKKRKKDLDTPTRLEVRYTEDISDKTLVR